MNTLDFSHESELTIEILTKRVEAHFPDADIHSLHHAYNFAEKAHKGQKRNSGEDYIIHPLNVAATLIKLKMDMPSIIAGLLHDVLEDCDINQDDFEKEFSPTVYQIVVGLTKISKIKFKTKEENQAENFRKMVVAMAKDIRVIIVKLADRMHNMRTLQYISEVRQKAIAKETLDIYVSLSGRLGIHSVKAELEDLCLRYLHPESYYLLAEKISMKKSEREKYIKETVDIIKENLLEYSVIAEVRGRPKHFFSIHKKMNQRGVQFEQIQDILAFRIIVSNITECYKSLGIIHSAFTPIPGRFKDYIAIPKTNNYQSLHTTVIGPKAERIEIQIRTYEMDEVAETGVAAHWKYKESINTSRTNLAWVDELLEYNRSLKNNNEFMDVIKNEIDPGGIFVFTPNGDVKELRFGSTPLDFAYSVHTEVGNLCIGAKINGKMAPLRYRLKSGDVVEILTSKTQTPSKDWLKIVKTSKAKTKIKQWLLKIERDKFKKYGEEALEKGLKVYDTTLKILKKSGDFDIILNKLNMKTEDEVFVQLGSNRLNTKDLMAYLPSYKVSDEIELEKATEEISRNIQKITKFAKKSSSFDNAIIVEGLDDVLVRIAKCCNPIPGDPITGYITRGRGITIHTEQCSKKNEDEIDRNIKVAWNNNFNFKHPVAIRVITIDKPGILAKISESINNIGVNIRSAVVRSLPDKKGNFIFEVEVSDYSELLKLMSIIESKENVISVSRI